jgi:hypothetical protein
MIISDGCHQPGKEPSACHSHGRWASDDSCRSSHADDDSIEKKVFFSPQEKELQ